MITMETERSGRNNGVESGFSKRALRKINAELEGKTRPGRPMSSSSKVVEINMEIMSIALGEACKTELPGIIRGKLMQMAFLARQANGCLEGQSDI